MRLFSRLLAIAAPLLLTGCLLSPGKFASSLDLGPDGGFTFRYKGEIVVLDTTSKPPEFTPSTCYDDESYEERDCTEDELAQQRAEFEEQLASAGSSNGPSGGLPGLPDLSTEDGIRELAADLAKQKGWVSAVYRGDRTIDVEYEISGRTDQGFQFPAVEGGVGVSPFVTITARKDGSVKVVAPGYSNGDGGLGALAGAGASNGPKKAIAEGLFTITTSGTILTNNTEDGPGKATDGRAMLSWRVNARSDKAPEALVRPAG